MTILAFPAGIGSHSSRTTNSVGPTCDNAYDTPPATSVSTTFAEYGVTVDMSDKAELLERKKRYAHRSGTKIVSTVERPTAVYGRSAPQAIIAPAFMPG